MTDFPIQHDLDDELLSAYLDDELSPEERARVDARLAVDPGARQTLDQLRDASQAMKNLPAEKVGQDLRESILHRAEQAMLTSAGCPSTATRPDRIASAESVTLPDSLPQFTIGRTTRGWIWATLAVAAGLMMMFLQPDAEQNDDLPPVAAKSEEAIDKVADIDNAGRLELRSMNGPAPAAPAAVPADSAAESAATAGAATASTSTASSAPPSAPSVAPTAAPSRQSDFDSFGVAEGVSAGAPPLKSEAEALRVLSGSGREELSETLAAAPQRGQFRDEAKEESGNTLSRSAMEQPSGGAELSARSQEVTPRGAMAGGQSAPTSAVPAAVEGETLAKTVSPSSELLVVRVVVNREALQNKSFDQLLAKNGIRVEATPTSGVEATANEKVLRYETLTEADKDDRNWDRFADEPLNADLVLVEAPVDAIESSLADLNRDEASYLGVSIDDMPTVDTKAATEKDKLAKKLTTDLGAKFNRGNVPATQEVNLKLNDRWYYARTDEAGAAGQEFNFRGGGGGGFGGATKQQSDAGDVSSLGLEIANEPNRGRARRLMVRQLEEPQNEQAAGRPLSAESAVEDRSSAAQLQRFGGARQESAPPAQPDSGKLQVLFILTPNEAPPSSPAAGNRTE